MRCSRQQASSSGPRPSMSSPYRIVCIASITDSGSASSSLGCACVGGQRAGSGLADWLVEWNGMAFVRRHAHTQPVRRFFPLCVF